MPTSRASPSSCRPPRISRSVRASRDAIQYTLTDADSNELTHWANIFLERLRALPIITDVASDQANAGPMLGRHGQSARWHQASASCPPPSTTRWTTPSASVSSHDVYIAQPISRRARGVSSIPVRTRGNQRHLCEFLYRPAVPLTTLVNSEIKPAPDSHQSPKHVSVRHHLVQP